MDGPEFWMAVSGGGFLGISWYVRSLRESKMQTLRLWQVTPAAAMQDIRDTLAKAELEDRGGVSLGGSRAMFVKLVGESWVPSARAVPDRFGKPQAFVETETIERRAECTWERAKQHNGSASDREQQRDEAGAWRCKKVDETVDRVKRGDTLYVLDTASQAAALSDMARVRELHTKATRLKGKIEGGREVMRMLGRMASNQMKAGLYSAVSEWEEDLRVCEVNIRKHTEKEYRMKVPKEPPKDEEVLNILPFALRIDTNSFGIANLFSVNHKKWRPAPADPTQYTAPRRREMRGGGEGAGGGVVRSTVLGVTEVERVVEMGMPLCAMGYVSMEKGPRGRELVLRKLPGQPHLLESGSEEDIARKLQGNVGGLQTTERVLAFAGFALIGTALNSFVKKQNRR